MTITAEQLAGITSRVQTLTDHKKVADEKTASSNQADTEVGAAQSSLADAQGKAAQAKLDEAAADGQVTADLKDLTTYLESLTGPPSPASMLRAVKKPE